MSRFDHSVLTWQVGASFRWEELRNAYMSDRYDGVYLRIASGSRLASLEFLDDLPELKYVEVSGVTVDDSHAFKLEGLREVVLLTRCQVAVPSLPESTLEAVSVDNRSGLQHLSMLPALRLLQIWGFEGRSLADLSNSSALSRLEVEGTRQHVSLAGLESCGSLADVELLEMRVESLWPLRGLSKLRRLWLIGDSSFMSANPLMLEDLSALDALEELRMTYQGSIASVDPLLNMPLLRDLRLRGTRVADGNLDPLAVLADRAVVVGPAE